MKNNSANVISMKMPAFIAFMMLMAGSTVCKATEFVPPRTSAAVSISTVTDPKNIVAPNEPSTSDALPAMGEVAASILLSFDTQFKNIQADCRTNRGCLARFSLAISDESQNSESVKFFFQKWFSTDNESFSGFAQRLIYTEVKSDLPPEIATNLVLKDGSKFVAATGDQLELQVGFGYRVDVKQKDAKGSIGGTAGAIPFAAAGEKSTTAFVASIIGLANGNISGKCNVSNDNMQMLLCSMPLTPAADLPTFNSTVAGLSNSLMRLIGDWSKDENSNEPSLICPQIVAARVSRISHERVDVNLNVGDAIKLQGELNTPACVTRRPNVRVVFMDDVPQHASGSIGGGAGESKQSNVTQGYYRNVNYFPKAYDSTNDRYVETWIKTSDHSAASPSLLGVVLNAQATQNFIGINVDSKIDSGIPVVASMLPDSTGALIADYVAYVTQLRTAVDGVAPGNTTIATKK